jgi:hypothetical protein
MLATLPSRGWLMLNEQQVDLTQPSNSQPFRVTKM